MCIHFLSLAQTFKYICISWIQAWLGSCGTFIITYLPIAYMLQRKKE
jgi:hypothetical protein